METTTQATEKKVIGALALKNQFDPYYEMVLGSYLERHPRLKKGERAKFTITKPLPTKEGYEKLKRDRFTTRLDDVVSNVSNYSDLASELRDWYDNLPESFQQGDKGSMLDESASTLENISEPAVPDWAGAMAVYCPPMLDISSRADRRDAISHELQQAVDAIDEALTKGRFPLKDDDEGNMYQLPPEDAEDTEQRDELQSLKDELENIISEAEGVEFPGMYS